MCRQGKELFSAVSPKMLQLRKDDALDMTSAVDWALQDNYPFVSLRKDASICSGCIVISEAGSLSTELQTVAVKKAIRGDNCTQTNKAWC